MAQNDYRSRILRCVKNTANRKTHTHTLALTQTISKCARQKKDNQTQSTLAKSTRNDKEKKMMKTEQKKKKNNKEDGDEKKRFQHK